MRIPTKPDSLAVGYHLGEADDDGFRTLFDAQDNIVATAQGDLNAVSTLVKLSHLVSSSLVDIIASYQDPEGRPLFGV
ncbi:hypothetical protein ASG82_10530 [Mycobacterium sp. Soil538]|nr:hypothetical protein ASG82_10530 [Mycobacterium sp. Soil538]